MSYMLHTILSRSAWMRYPNKYLAWEILKLLSSSILKFVTAPVFILLLPHFCSFVTLHPADWGTQDVYPLSAWGKVLSCISSVIQHVLIDFPSALALSEIPRHHDTVENSSELCKMNPVRAEGASHQCWSLRAADKPLCPHFRHDVNELLIYRI